MKPEQIHKAYYRCIVKIDIYDFNGNLVSNASGVILKDYKSVITNYHVIRDNFTIIISTEGITLPFEGISYSDIYSDILIIRLRESKKFPQIKIGDSSKVNTGNLIYALGCPLGQEDTITSGRVSYKKRNLIGSNKTKNKYIQIDALLGGGSSGGALVNEKGELIGITTLTIAGNQASNYVIPINSYKRPLIESIKQSIKTVKLKFTEIQVENAISNDRFDIALSLVNSLIRNGQVNYHNYYYRGYCKMKLGMYDLALSDYTKALKLNKRASDVLKQIGYIYNLREDYKKAIHYLTASLKISEGDSECLNYRATAYYHIGKVKEALKDLNQVIKINPEEEKAYLLKGKILSNEGNIKLAKLEYEKAININPNNPETYYLIATNLLNSEELYKVCKLLTKAIELDNSNYLYFLKRAEVYTRLYQLEDAIKDYKEVAYLNPKYKALHFHLGSTYMACNQHEEAIRSFNICIKESIKLPESYNSRGVCYRSLGYYKKGKKDILKSLKYNSSFNESLFNLTEIYYGEYNFKKSSDYFTKAKTNSNQLPNLKYLAYYYYSMGKPEEALYTYDKWVKAEPKNIDAYLNRVYFKMLLGFKYKFIIKDFSKCESLNYNYYPLLVNRALFYALNEKFDKCISDINNAEKVIPENKSVSIVKALLNLFTENYEECIKYSKEMLKLGMNSDMCYYLIAFSHYRLNQYNEALKTAKLVLNLDNANMRGLQILALVYGKTEVFKKALSYSNLAVKTGPDWYRNYLARGIAYLGLKKYKESERDLITAVEMKDEKNDLEPELYLGKLFMQIGRYKDAQKYFKQIINIKPNYLGYYYLGALYYKMRKYNKALEQINISLSKNSNHSQSYMALASILVKMKLYTQLTYLLEKAVLNSNKKLKPIYLKLLKYSNTKQYNKIVIIDN